MAAATLPSKLQMFVVASSTAYTLREEAIAILSAALWSGSTTQTGFTTATITTATSSVLNSLAFTGTQATPSKTITTNSGVGAASLLLVEYVPAGEVESAK